MQRLRFTVQVELFVFSNAGCDRKCNGCMNVNGIEKCHWAPCMPLGNSRAASLEKRNQMKIFPMAPREQNIERSVDYQIDDISI